jgi:hypothetical protein
MLLATALFNGSLSGSTCFLNWIVDGTTRAGAANVLVQNSIVGGGTQLQSVMAVALFSGLAPGSHTFKLQYRGNGTGAANVLNNGPVITLLALEV